MVAISEGVGEVGIPTEREIREDLAPPNGISVTSAPKTEKTGRVSIRTSQQFCYSRCNEQDGQPDRVRLMTSLTIVPNCMNWTSEDGFRK